MAKTLIHSFNATTPGMKLCVKCNLQKTSKRRHCSHFGTKRAIIKSPFCSCASRERLSLFLQRQTQNFRKKRSVNTVVKSMSMPAKKILKLKFFCVQYAFLCSLFLCSSTHSQQIVSRVLNNIRPEIEKMVKEAFQSFANDFSIELNKVKHNITDLKKSHEFLSAEYDDLKEKYSKLLKSSKQSERSTNQLNLKLDEIETNQQDEFHKIDDPEQYGRRLNLEFEGIPEQKEENVTKIVLDIAKKLNVDASCSDISIAHRLPPKRHNQRDGSSSPPTIIAQFTNKRIRNAIYSRRKEAKNIKDFPVPEMTKLFVNENLTHYRKKLFWSTKRAAKASNYKFFWTANGKILVKKDDNAPVIAILSETDIDNLS